MRKSANPVEGFVDRRNFQVGGLTALLACACPLHGHTETRLRGCRAAVLVDGVAASEAVRAAVAVSPEIQDVCQRMWANLSKVFQVLPILTYIPGGNAFAEANGNAGGSIFVGKDLIERYWNVDHDSIQIIMAHEFAHLAQFKRGVPDAWPGKPPRPSIQPAATRER